MDTLIYWFYLCTKICKKDDDMKYIKSIYFASFPLIFNLLVLVFLSNKFLFNSLFLVDDSHLSLLRRKLRGFYIGLPFAILIYIIFRINKDYIIRKLKDFENQRVENIKSIRIKLAIYLVLSVVILLVMWFTPMEIPQ